MSACAPIPQRGPKPPVQALTADTLVLLDDLYRLAALRAWAGR